ncbi:[Fe-Fe] hydrogenase large subunit C-terminal domain-containing protein [Thermoanaerobacterium sp. DL9XJH110]|uniref:[Fe-Fe] hydrogenase large subunit C-terminal domain-containing protein n=1 Tax=Thermoanaerobacterium sp. DL9XJH110 TaxID=3386643 RepID=UPI003BB60AF2
MNNDMEVLEHWLTRGSKIVASIAPSYVVEFDERPKKIAGALKSLGFYGVEETIAVLPEIIEARHRAVKKSNNPVIFNSCPVVWNLIETRYPHLKKFILNLPSPMILHARRLKRKFNDAKIVFLGPCMAKKWEQSRFYNETTLDLVLTFREIREVFKRHGISISQQNEENFLSDAPLWVKLGALVYYKSGIESVIKLLDNWEYEKPDCLAMELLACEGGCINGPGITSTKTLEQRTSFYQKRILAFD